MKTEKKNLTYFEIFPNAKFEITASNGKNTPINTNPKQIQTIIRSIFQLDYPPPFIQIQHSALAEKVIVLIFDGLDVSRYIKYKEYLPNFVQLTVPQFPIFVEAMEKDGFVVGGIKTLLGIQQPKTIPKQYANFEEMLLTDQQLIENGYPFKKEGVDVSQYEYYNAYNKQLTEEDLKSYSELPDKEEGVEKEKIIAIDAEMIDTSVGNELARLSATNIKGETILDQLFKPLGEVTDYKTQFSGITEETLKDVDVPSTDGIKILSKIADKDTIIIGHSLENDLRALKLIHYRCIDTAILYIERRRKTSLALLYQKHIGKPFRTQTSEGHDSAEDARAAIELAEFAIKQPVGTVQEPPKLPDFIFDMLNLQKKVALVDLKSRVKFEGVDDRLNLVLTNSDEETMENTKKVIQDNDLIFAHFDNMNGLPLTDEAEIKGCQLYNEILGKLLEVCPLRTAVFVYAPNGNFIRVKANGDIRLPPGYDQARRSDFMAIRQGLLWIHCTETNQN